MRQTRAQLSAALETSQARIRVLEGLLEWARQNRDRSYQRLSTYAAENIAYRAQRDAAVIALQAVLDVLAASADVRAAEAERLARPLLAKHDIVERYRRLPVVPPDAHKTG